MLPKSGDEISKEEKKSDNNFITFMCWNLPETQSSIANEGTSIIKPLKINWKYFGIHNPEV